MATTAPSESPAESPRYCCYGCRFAHAVVQEQGEEGAIRWTVLRLGLAIFFTMNLMAFTMVMWSLDVYDVRPDPFELKLFEMFRWLSMVLAVPVLLLLGLPLFQNAVQSRRRRSSSTDLLIVLAVVAAYLTSMCNVLRATGSTYFEVGATVLVMITLGRWIEAAGRQRATEALDELRALLPDTVMKLPADTALTQLASTTLSEISSEDVRTGDLIRIRAGDRFPVDAEIALGSTTVDEQVFTGESEPAQKSVSDSVLAGTVNLDGDLVVRVTAEFRQGAFGRLLHVLSEARRDKGYYQRLADHAAAWFFPIVVATAIGTFVWNLSGGLEGAIHTAMSVLLIACPCALGLATPLAVWTALSTAVLRQVLFRSGEALERLAQTKAVCLDKTGTLTTGIPQVTQTAFFGDGASQAERLMLARLLANASSHPFSTAIAKHLHEPTEPTHESHDTSTHGAFLNVRDVRTVAGGGVEATTHDGKLVRLGSVEFACCRLHDSAHETESPVPDLCASCRAPVSLSLRVQLDRLRMAADQSASSIVLLSIDKTPVAGFLIAETTRHEAPATLKQLTHDADRLYVLSGDREAKGRFLCEQLQVPGLQIECRLSPEQKVLRVAEIRRQIGTTVMVGDGINDAPALAASDVGIAMGCGADVSRDSAQVCLLSNDLSQVPWAIRFARRTTSIIRQNLFWAFGYNAIGVAFAAAGYLNPAVAAALMIGSSLLVISNSLRLLRDSEPSTDLTMAPNENDSITDWHSGSSEHVRAFEKHETTPAHARVDTYSSVAAEVAP